MVGSNQDDDYTSEKTLFVEQEQALNLIVTLASDVVGRSDALTSLRSILNRYLEAPTLLDPYLAALVTPLGEFCETNDDCTYALSAIYSISKVRGRKRIARFLPHSVDLVETVLGKLLGLIDQNSEHRQDDQWESVYVSWMWLELLSLTPFNRHVVLQSTTIPTLIQTAKAHLSEAGPVRETAATCLASWLARQDMQDCVQEFCQWSHSILEDYVFGKSFGVFLPLGVLQTLCGILKVGTRESYQQQLPLWECMLGLAELQSNPNTLLRKYLSKWMARMGCAHMPPRIAKWRYQRGGRTKLLENLQGQTNAKDDTRDAEILTDKDEALFEVPDAVEDVMGHLLLSLKDKATVVRWSAAKGIGRLTERLPLLCAHDVLDALIDQLYRNKDNDTVWHGSCLALGELARRGLLLPERLNDVIEPILIPAIHFDIRKGHTSVGAHVRDAACYTYWAFARAYSPAVLKPHVGRMSQSIVVASLFDREVNCRRAASAAFQESVGRQGAQNFVHGIEILTTADYYTLGNRNLSYTSIARSIAGFAEYRRPIIDHLYAVKLFHWDISIRILASKSLHEMACLDPGFIQHTVIPSLLEKCSNSELFIRHGAVLGLAEIVLALQLELTSDLFPVLSELVEKLEKLRLYRGRGGEVMRAAVCRYIECLSHAKVPLSVKQQVRLLDSVDEQLRHPNEEIQKAAGAALAALMRSYFPVRENGPSQRLQQRVVDKYIEIIDNSDHPAETRGFSLGLGSLPKKLLAPSTVVLLSVIDCLSRSARFDGKVGIEGDAETRRNAITALLAVCREVGITESRVPPTVALSESMLKQVFESFLLGLEDYNTDRRGDVGSWSRISAMTGLEQLVYFCFENKVDVEPSLMIRIFGGLLKQLSEKLDNVRFHAGSCIERMLQSTTPFIPNLPFREDLIESLIIGKDTKWSDAKATFKMVCQAMNIPNFFYFIVSGIVISVGALTESVTKEAQEALIEWIRANQSESQHHVELLGYALVKLFQEQKRKRRVVLPLLKTLDNLINRGLLDCLLSNQDLNFASSLLACLKAETSGCDDIYRLLTAVGVSLGLLSPLNKIDVNQDLLVFIHGMLAHDFPRVRKYTADHLYVRLLEDPSVLHDVKNEDEISDLLLLGEWQSDLTHEQMDQLCSKLAALMCLKVTIARLPMCESEVSPKDEFSSYASLVKATLCEK